MGHAEKTRSSARGDFSAVQHFPFVSEAPAHRFGGHAEPPFRWADDVPAGGRGGRCHPRSRRLRLRLLCLRLPSQHVAANRVRPRGSTCPYGCASLPVARHVERPDDVVEIALVPDRTPRWLISVHQNGFKSVRLGGNRTTEQRIDRGKLRPSRQRAAQTTIRKSEGPSVDLPNSPHKVD